MWKVISNSLDIGLIHDNIHGRSCKKVLKHIFCHINIYANNGMWVWPVLSNALWRIWYDAGEMTTRIMVRGPRCKWAVSQIKFRGHLFQILRKYHNDIRYICCKHCQCTSLVPRWPPAKSLWAHVHKLCLHQKTDIFSQVQSPNKHILSHKADWTIFSC